MNIAINDKVVCVRDDIESDLAVNYSELPVKGRTYVGRGIVSPEELAGDDPSDYGLLLVGIVGEVCDGTEWSFWHWRFRKLEEIKLINQLKAAINSHETHASNPNRHPHSQQ